VDPPHREELRPRVRRHIVFQGKRHRAEPGFVAGRGEVSRACRTALTTIALAVCLGSAPAAAQRLTYTAPAISGIVIDASTGRTLAGVSVLVRWAGFKDNPNLREFERALSQFPVAGMPYELEH